MSVKEQMLLSYVIVTSSITSPQINLSDSVSQAADYS